MHRVSKTQQSNTNTTKSKKIKDIKKVLEVSNVKEEQFKEIKFLKQQEKVLDKQIQFTEQPDVEQQDVEQSDIEQPDVEQSDVEQPDVVEPKILQNLDKNRQYIDVDKYKKISSIELDKYSNDDLASVLFIRFRKDDNPLAKLALEIHRTIINPFRIVKNKDFSKQTIQNLQTEQRNYKRKQRNIKSDTIVKPGNGKDIVVSIR